MEIRKQLEGKELQLAVSGRLDTTTAAEFEKAVKETLEDVETLIIDFTDLEYISSAGLRVLLSAQKVMSRQGGMKLKGVGDVVMDILEITGFSNILTIE